MQATGDQRDIALAFFIWRFLCNDRNCRIAVSHSLRIFYPFYVCTFSFSVYVLFVCILFVLFFLVYVSSLYFLLYKHTGEGGGGYSLIKGLKWAPGPAEN